MSDHDCHTQNSHDDAEARKARHMARRELRMALQDAMDQLLTAAHAGDDQEDVYAATMAYELARPVRAYMNAVRGVTPDAMDEAVERANAGMQDLAPVHHRPPAMRVLIVLDEGGEAEPEPGTPVAPFAI